MSLDALVSFSQKGAGLIMKSVTGQSGNSFNSNASNRNRPPPPMTPSAKKVFHMMTTQEDKKDAVHQLKKNRDSLKTGIHQLSMQALDSTWIMNEDYVINPRSHLRKAWDLLLTLLVFYLISILPWQLGVDFYHSPVALTRFDTFLGTLR